MGFVCPVCLSSKLSELALFSQTQTRCQQSFARRACNAPSASALRSVLCALAHSGFARVLDVQNSLLGGASRASGSRQHARRWNWTRACWCFATIRLSSVLVFVFKRSASRELCAASAADGVELSLSRRSSGRAWFWGFPAASAAAKRRCSSWLSATISAAATNATANGSCADADGFVRGAIALSWHRTSCVQRASAKRRFVIELCRLGLRRPSECQFCCICHARALIERLCASVYA